MSEPIETRPCAVCGAAFTPRNRLGRYCSKACCDRAMRRKFDPPKAALPPQFCRYCRDLIDPKGEPARRRVRCDKQACIDAYHLDWKRRRNAKRAAGRTRTCAVCGTSFPAPVGVLKDVCSPTCDRTRRRVWTRDRLQRMRVEEPEKYQRLLEQHNERERRRREDPAYRERVRHQSREQKRREYRRRAELDQLRDFDQLARALDAQ